MCFGKSLSVCLSVCLCVCRVRQGFSSCGTQNRMGLGPFVVAWFTVGHCSRQIPIGVDLMENRRFPWSFLLLFCCAKGLGRDPMCLTVAPLQILHTVHKTPILKYLPHRAYRVNGRSFLISTIPRSTKVLRQFGQFWKRIVLF